MEKGDTDDEVTHLEKEDVEGQARKGQVLLREWIEHN